MGINGLKPYLVFGPYLSMCAIRSLHFIISKKGNAINMVLTD